MRLEDALKATELSEEMIEAIAACGSTPLTLAAWIVEANTAKAALDAVPWEEIRWAAYKAVLFVEWTPGIKTVLDWCDANAPKEEVSK